MSLVIKKKKQAELHSKVKFGWKYRAPAAPALLVEGSAQQHSSLLSAAQNTFSKVITYMRPTRLFKQYDSEEE